MRMTDGILFNIVLRSACADLEWVREGKLGDPPPHWKIYL